MTFGAEWIVKLQSKQTNKHKTLRGSKVGRESDLRSVPYNRPVDVRSFVKNAENRIQCRPLYSSVT